MQLMIECLMNGAAVSAASDAVEWDPTARVAEDEEGQQQTLEMEDVALVFISQHVFISSHDEDNIPHYLSITMEEVEEGTPGSSGSSPLFV